MADLDLAAGGDIPARLRLTSFFNREENPMKAKMIAVLAMSLISLSTLALTGASCCTRGAQCCPGACCAKSSCCQGQGSCCPGDCCK
jgi:hypothetical protein